MDRIKSLDGLRCVAIAMVIAYHFFARWTTPFEPLNLYPYGNILAGATQYGYLGVQLFFVISGFVITLTLTRCTSMLEFAIRRLARLWPTMAICSTLTYSLCHLIPSNPFQTSAADFLPSLTFTVPHAFNVMFRTDRFDWMDGVYWSLFVEVRFYALAAVLYFLDPHKYARNTAVASTATLAAYTLCSIWGHSGVARAIDDVLIAHYLPWFLMGIGFYEMHAGRRFWPLFTIAVAGLLCQSREGEAAIILLQSAAWVIPLVWVALRTRVGNRIFSSGLIASVGSASYSLYLLHQRIGVAIIHAIGVETGVRGPWTLGIAMSVAAVMTLTATQIYRHWEKPLNRVMIEALSARRPAPIAG